MKYSQLLTPVPQTEPLDSRQVPNNAGGYVYELDDWKRLDRFLIQGSDASTYYVSAQKLTRENAKVVERCFTVDTDRTVARIVELSVAGRAPKNDPAIFAIALGASATEVYTRQRALNAMPAICRTGTHLFQFVVAVRSLGRGWGRSLKRAIANWYETKSPDDLAYQVVKYRQRENMTHRDLLRLSHPDGTNHANLYRWVCGKETLPSLPSVVTAHIKAMACETPRELTDVLLENTHLPWEAIPTWALNGPKIWEVMAPYQKLNALVRNLGNMTRIGAIAPFSETEKVVAKMLLDETKVKRSRMHPLAILQAMKIYEQGHGLKGSGTWAPSRAIIDALDDAFYTAFANATPTGKRILLALDVSGSMTSPFAGSAVSCRDATAALALVTMRTEQPLHTHVVGFTSTGHSQRRYGGVWGGEEASLTPINISPNMRLTHAVQQVSNLPFGGTDCALPMLYAAEKKLPIDAFVVYTDNETWAGQTHPMKALKDYRSKFNIGAKLIVVGMTSTGFTIGDPNDVGCLDVVGFDSSVPQLIGDFIRG